MTTTPDSTPRPRTSAATARHRTRFFDHRVPSLYPGRYEIANRQILRDVDGADRIIDAAPQPFEVVQPRFSLPAAAVNARFPVPDAVGTYSRTLPHINLDVPGLPWSRPLGPGHDAGVPWTALLLFREGELPEDREALGLVTAGTVRQLLAGELGPGTPPALAPDSLPEGDQKQHCATVLVPAALFDAVKPLPEEMGYLAHVREGGPPDATLSGNAPDNDPEPDEQELNAVVVANRFPAAAGGRHVVHLVSLEGFDAYLGAPAPGDGVRLVSLTSWTFTSEADSGTGFGDLAQHLATGDGSTPRPAAELRLAVPVSAPVNPSAHEREVVDRLAGGGVALPQRLETGERTVAFHRGPLTARPAQQLPAPAATRLESPGEALVYLESYGVFDTAYAAAFTAGRTLALADETFRSTLLEFRSSARRALRRLAARPQAAIGTSAARLLTASPAFDAFDRMLQDGEGERFVAAVEQSGPRLRAGQRRADGPARISTVTPRATLSAPGVADVLTQAAGEQLEPVRAWLDRLRLLEMLAFEHLVPDARMLPPESIRFSYVDAGWVRAAVDGALSLGVGHALDADLNALATEGGPVPACAVLIRSDLVPHWPNTIVTAYAGGSVVEPLRTAVYGTDVQLLLYSAVIDRFELAEPPRGLCFGVGDVGTIELREISGDRIGRPKGEFPDPAGFGRFLRPGGRDVLNVHGPGDALVPALAEPHGVPHLSSAQFALQMINAPQVQNFTRP